MRTIRPQTTAALILLALVSAGAGCATRDGRMALREGRYDEAVTRFEQALARDPDRVEALIGLGIAKYRLGSYADAAAVLRRALVQAPKAELAQLYLGLAHLLQGQDAEAETELATAGAFVPGTRLATQIDRAIRVLRDREHVTDTVRTYIATSLENDAVLESQLRAAEAAARDAEILGSIYAYPGPYFVRTHGGRLVPVFP